MGINSCFPPISVGLHSEVGSVSDSSVRGPGLDIQSRNLLWFLLPLIQEGQLSVNG